MQVGVAIRGRRLSSRPRSGPGAHERAGIVKELVAYLARALVDHPEPVGVVETAAPGESQLQLRVGKEDLGKVIGKKGRTAKALRTLLAAAGAKQGLRVNLEIVEPTDPAATPHAAGADSVPAEAPASDSASPEVATPEAHGGSGQEDGAHDGPPAGTGSP